MDIDTFMARAEHKVKSSGCELIVVDYAQLMEADPKRYPSQTLQLEAISKGFHKTARKLNVPMIVIVHVNKEGQDHGTKQFEKDAHVRVVLHYKRGELAMGIDVIKNRNGRTAMINTPCVMRHGIVGRNGPPHWAEGGGRIAPPKTNGPHPDNRIDDDPNAPF
jgi:predicted ATP-dependent serine protease